MSLSTPTALDSSVRTPGRKQFLEDVIHGLSQPLKTLPYKYFYDERGSQLFDQICHLDEYYLTRTERQILAQHGPAMCQWIGPDALIFEPGAGSSIKVEALLEHLQQPVAYVPVDISSAHLMASSERLQQRFPHIPVLPMAADYSTPFSLPPLPRTPQRTVAFYPGSTIGNFAPEGAIQFLTRLARLVGPGGGLLIGFDRKKDARILEAAYNDQAGVTRDFHFNLLERINDQLGADFVLEQFAHHAPFNDAHSRIEMHLVSRRAQEVTIEGHTFAFAEGETICTEYSYKRTPDALSALAGHAGFVPRTLWTDEEALFAVMSFDIPPH